MPEGDNQEVVRLGYGVANWIWNNRGRTPKKWLDRIYLEDAERKQQNRKRKAEAPATTAANTAAPVKRNKVRAPDNVPNTREEFLAIQGFQQLITGHHEE
jgi:hypothetical protein